MSELEKIFYTAAFTIFGGVMVYVIGQLLSKFMIDPTHELKKVIGEVRFNLAFYGATIHTPIGRTSERSDKAYEAILKSSCELLAKVNSIPFYGMASYFSLGFLPSKKQIRDAATQLRGLSTYLHEKDNATDAHINEINRRVKLIEGYLKLESLE